MKEILFRFEDMEIWQRAAAFSPELFELADQLDKKRLYRFAEQLRSAVLSITNNIAEGSGSTSKIDFANFLNISRRSVFEVANILTLLSRNNYLVPNDRVMSELHQESRMILAFMRTLKPDSSR